MAEGSGVQVSQDVWLPCPHCGKPLGAANGPTMHHPLPTSHATSMISCNCGHVSVMFPNMGELREWWNMRNGEKHEQDEVEYEHNTTPPDEF